MPRPCATHTADNLLQINVLSPYLLVPLILPGVSLVYRPVVESVRNLKSGRILLSVAEGYVLHRPMNIVADNLHIPSLPSYLS